MYTVVVSIVRLNVVVGIEFLGPLLSPVGPACFDQLWLLSPCLLWPKDLLFIIIRLQTHQKSDLITGGFDPPCGCWDLNSGPSEEQSLHLLAETSHHPLDSIPYCIWATLWTVDRDSDRFSDLLFSVLMSSLSCVSFSRDWLASPFPPFCGVLRRNRSPLNHLGTATQHLWGSK